MNDNAWLQTFYNKKFHLLDPQPEEIDIRDIVHALCHVNRFSGHTPWPYSVGQHSVLVMEEARLKCLAAKLDETFTAKVMRKALMHDATEAYFHDIPRPLKFLLPEYIEMELRLENVIGEKYGISNELPIRAMVRAADESLLYTEAVVFFGKENVSDWDMEDFPAHASIEEQVKRQWTPEYTRSRFHTYFRALFSYSAF